MRHPPDTPFPQVKPVVIFLRGPFPTQSCDSTYKAIRSCLAPDNILIQGEASSLRIDLLRTTSSSAKLILLDSSCAHVFDTCRELRAHQQLCSIPIVAIGPALDNREQQRFLHAGGTGFITALSNQNSLIRDIYAYIGTQSSAQVVSHISGNEKKDSWPPDHSDLLNIAKNAGDDSNRIRRVQHYTRTLAIQLSRHSLYTEHLTSEYIDLLYRAAPLYEVRKYSIRDQALRKAIKLDAADPQSTDSQSDCEIWMHQPPHEPIATRNALQAMVKDIICHIHEKWNGAGYPQGLAQGDIPISARIMAVTDVYDRVLRRGHPEIAHIAASNAILDGRGTHFDPNVVSAFFDIRNEFRAIEQQYPVAEFLRHSIEKEAGGRNNDSGMSQTSTPYRLPSDADPLLLALQKRADALPADAIPFALSILSRTSVVPRPLARLLMNILLSRASVMLEPVHLALADIFSASLRHKPESVDLRQSGIAMIHACHQDHAAITSLDFIKSLTSLIPPESRKHKGTHEL